MRRPRSRLLAGVLVMSLPMPAALPAAPSSPPGEQPASPSTPAHAAGATPDWWSRVQADIRKSEYSVSWQEKTLLPEAEPAYQAPNRAQNLRTYFTAKGVRLVPRTAEAPRWQVGLSLTSIGAGSRLAPVGEGKPEVNGNRVEYRRGGTVEWYVNDERGLEQGFTVAARPFPVTTNEPLRIALSVSGNATPRLSEDGNAVEFLAPGGALALRYADLVTVDARGHQVASWMELSDCAGEGSCALHLVVADAGATYPLTIDPLATSPNWTAESNQGSAFFGASVGTAGDVNGDGYADVIVGAPSYDNGQTGEGRAWVYHGSAAGLSAAASWTAEGNQAGADFGWSVGTAGDVNADGYSDVVVGAPHWDNGQTNEGRAYAYHGSASGLALSANWTAESDVASGRLGGSVAAAGDVNRDGYADVIVGAYSYGNGQSGEGAAFVYHGSVAGLTPSPNWTAESNQALAYFGYSVGTAGDVNADGYADVIVGAPYYDNGQAEEGRAFVYLGSATGLAPSPTWTAESNQASASLGYSVGTAGDVNGDTYADLIVGAGAYDNGEASEGRAYAFYGSSSGPSLTPSWTAESNQANADFGDSVGTAGDVNGDGYADAIVAAAYYDNGETNEGRVFVYYGSASGLLPSASWTTESNQADAHFGYGAAATAGDVNGDGFSDVIVGAAGFDNGQTDEGRAFVYHGSASGLMTSPSWTAESDQASAYYGLSVATAGSVNADSYADVIVGAPFYDGGQANQGRAFVYLGSASGLSTTADWTFAGTQADAYFGYSVGTAGDVHSDGFADVIVGVPGFDNGEADEGGVVVYYGNEVGLGAAGVWRVEGGQPGASFGTSVGTAGDVNGDGHADVIVGAPYHDGAEVDEGRAFVFHGSRTGLSPTATWTVGGSQANARLGRAVGTAGDVNGDGYADVVVGAGYYDNGEMDEGRAYVYHGSTLGLSTVAGWTAEGDQAGARFGWAVGVAGDVNGDGYADLIVGAPSYENGEAIEGRAYVYHGSPLGLTLAPNWTAEGNQASASFGAAVGTAGDVNGDGYADAIVGAYGYDNGQAEEGRAYAYHGSALGLALSPGWTAEGNQIQAYFGYSVGTAGDVNGDGYADVIVGAPFLDNAEADEGRAFVYYGNSAGRPVRTRQLSMAGGAFPVAIQPWGASWGTSAFRVGLANTHPLGWNRMKTEVEVCPSGQAFGAPACIAATSPDWVTGGASGAFVAQQISGLTYRKLYRWRARTLYAPYSVTEPGITAPPQPAHGPWRRYLGQAMEADLRVIHPDLIFADGFEVAPFTGVPGGEREE